MKLLKSISSKINLSAKQIKQIEMIDSHIDADSERIKMLVAKDSLERGIKCTEEYLNEGIFNLKLYYVVALLDPINEHAVSEMVDPFWHSHILLTRRYHDFCSSIFEQYLHHEPLNKESTNEVAHIDELYTYTLNVYKEMFKDEAINSNWWPLKSLVCMHGADERSGDKIESPLFQKRSTVFPVAA